MVGLHNLYWYYGSQTYKKDTDDKLVHTSEAFQGFIFILTYLRLTFVFSKFNYCEENSHPLATYSMPFASGTVLVFNNYKFTGSL